MSTISALDTFLDSNEADNGLTEQSRYLISQIPGDEDEAYKYFANIVVPKQLAAPSSSTSQEGKDESSDEEYDAQAARRSYRAMSILKQDMSMAKLGYPPIVIKNPAQAGLLAKDLFAGLAVAERKRYSTLHIRELLDALVEAYPEKVMSAASAGGKQGIQDHLGPLLSSDQTLPVLTHLVCYGCTGRKGIASAEKSAQHTQRMYQDYQASGGKSAVGMGQRKKFVRACMEFQLFGQLADALTAPTTSSSSDVGEEVCEAILTMIELIGYPPDEVPQQVQQQGSKKGEVVGEDVLLNPLATSDWWVELLSALRQPTCTPQQRLAIARTCMQAFSLATGNSSRICKSHAPATDATEQTSEKIVEEKEEKLHNRLIEWGLTDKIHSALVAQIPLLIQALELPNHDVLSYNATFSIVSEESVDEAQSLSIIRHPGRYKTVPLGSWRLQLLALLKEIIVYQGGEKASPSSPAQAMDAIMVLPLPSELAKKSKKGEEEKEKEDGDIVVFNPWPAFCSYVWAYPNNDFYSIVFFEMLRSAVLEHHEATLRVILQKSKFLSRAVKTVVTSPGPLKGVLLNCLNLLRLRAQSLPPSAFLPQYLSSHDGWKEHVEKVVEMTILQQTPIIDAGQSVNIDLGGSYAKGLGFGDITEYDATAAANEVTPSPNADASKQEGGAKKAGGKKKKKNNKKKKK